MTPLVFFVKGLICSGVLFGYYYLFLRNKQFHRYNRFYLIASVVLSITIPFFRIPVFFTGNPSDELIYQTIDVITVTNVDNDFMNSWGVNSNWFSVQYATTAFYCCGVLLMLFFLLQSINYIRKISRKYTAKLIDDIQFYNTVEPGTPFSFFKSIYWNTKIDPSSDEGQQIFRHEMFHVRQFHSADILFAQIVGIIFWMNPFFHLMKKELKAIHEFLADQYAISGNNKYTYAEMLLAQSIKSNKPFAGHSIFANHIKRRITMITKFKTSYSYWSRLMILPIAFLLFCFIALRAQNQNSLRSSEKRTWSHPITILNETPEDTIPFFKKYKSEDIYQVEVKGNTVIVRFNNGDSIVSQRMTFIEELKNIEMEARNEVIKRSHENYQKEQRLREIQREEIEKMQLDAQKEQLQQMENPHIDQKLRERKFEELRKTQLDAAQKEKIIQLDNLQIQEKLRELQLEELKNHKQLNEVNEQIERKLREIQLEELKKMQLDAENQHKKIKEISQMEAKLRDRQFEEMKKLEERELIQKREIALEQMKKIHDANIQMQKSKEELIKEKLIAQKHDPGNIIFTKTEIEAQYPGGPHAWMEYLRESIRYPSIALEKNISGTVIVQFIVNRNGDVHQIEAIQGPVELREEAVRIIKESGRWIPAIQNGIKVKAYKRMPVFFRLDT